MIIGAVKEKNKFENRVAISPEEAKKLCQIRASSFN
jgi:alanine dehydrogenase